MNSSAFLSKKQSSNPRISRNGGLLAKRISLLSSNVLIANFSLLAIALICYVCPRDDTGICLILPVLLIPLLITLTAIKR